MPSAFEEVFIGPFVGGLNTLSDQTSIGDTELFRCDNFEIDLDGSLVSRPPVLAANSGLSSTNGLDLLCYYVESGTGTVYLIASNRVDTTYYYNGSAFSTITASFAATAAIQYRDKVYLVAPLSSSNPGGTWTPSGGFTADSNMPKGVAIVANKERLWICQGKSATSNGSRVYVTDIVSGAPAWNGNYISINSGDGQNVVDLCVYNSDLIIFKQRSTYRFAFGADVSTGFVSTLSTTIGANDTGCYVAYEQQIYMTFNQDVYEFTNYVFNRINMNTPLVSTSPGASYTKPFGISAWANRLFVSYYEKVYVYNLRNRTWSTWSSPTRWVSLAKVLPYPYEQTDRPRAYMSSSQPLGTGQGKTLYQCYDSLSNGTPGNSTQTELFTCTFETKNYDFMTPSKYKRLGWWGGDVLTRSDLDVYAQPVQYARTVTWGELAEHNWGDPEINTWGALLTTSYTIADHMSISDTSVGRKFIKFLQSLRFRQISFKVVAMTYGNRDTAPVRVYRLSAYVSEKQRVSKKMT